MFRLLALTGMRLGELVALRWSDLDLARSTMTVNQASTVVDRVEVVSVPKTHPSRPVVDLDPVTVETLQRHRSGASPRYRDLVNRTGS